MKLFTELGGIERALDYHLDRQGVLASNLANAATPGYRARDLDFASYMDQADAMQVTSDLHLSGNEDAENALIFEQAPPKGDDNTVRIEKAMAQVAANRVRYEAGATLMRQKLALLRYAATDGASG